MYQATKAIQRKYIGLFIESDTMDQKMIVVKDGEITFKDTRQIDDFDEIRISPNTKWIYTKKIMKNDDGEKLVERWYPLIRIYEVRKEIDHYAATNRP